MKLILSNFLLLPTVIAASVVSVPQAGTDAGERAYDYVFFDNSIAPGSYCFSSVFYRTPSWVENIGGNLPLSAEHFSSPGNSLELRYTGSSWSARVDYAPLRGVEIFKRPDELSIRVMSPEGLSSDLMPDISIVSGDSSATASIHLGDRLTAGNLPAGEWQTLRIPLTSFSLGELPSGKKMISKFAAVVFSGREGMDGEHILYVDDIELLPASSSKTAFSAPHIAEVESWERHIDIRWSLPADISRVKYYKIWRSLDGGDFHPVAVRRAWEERYADYIGAVGIKAEYRITTVGYDLVESGFSNTVSGKTHPMTDSELLDMLQKANFRFYWEMAEPESGLSRENLPGRKDMIASGASGFGMMAIVAGVSRGFVSREQAVERFVRVTSFLEKADTYHGAFAHFIDGTTGKTIPWFGPRDNGGDLVETSFLMQGLLVARQFFDADNAAERRIRASIDRIWKRVEWDWYSKTPDSKYLYWHWSPDQAWTINHKLIGWNETLITYLLAIMSPSCPVSPSMYYSGWASQDTLAADYRIGWGRVKDGSMYTNGNTYYGKKLDVGVSNGGPLFFTHYSFMGLDPHRFTDKYVNYYENNRNIAEINLRYCMENPEGHKGYGAGMWGLTASDHMWGYNASEPVAYMDDGTIAPTGALASFPYLPDASMQAFLNYYRNYGHLIWGEYGFRDAFNLDENWVAPIYMGLNQAPVAVMVENYRSGFIWNLFMSHPDVKSGLEKFENNQ